MADYNIYIHAVGTGNSGGGFAPTTPWADREGGDGASPTQAWGSSSGGFLKSAVYYARMLSNPDSIVGSAISTAFKTSAIFAAAYGAVRLGVDIYSKVLDFSSLLGGQSAERVELENSKMILSKMFSPFNTTIEYQKNYISIKHENYRRKQERELLGDSVINSYTGRGV